jgi:glycosyltransferase involved in cell wall biosynthesis
MEIKISAIVVGRNESAKLSACLNSLGFCDEILYADLDSMDNSIEVAKQFNCRIYEYKTFGPAGEYTQSELINFVNNDWVIILDPDEVMTAPLIEQVKSQLPEISQNEAIGAVFVPWQFYFGKKRLSGTVWGYNNEKAILINKLKYEIRPVTHYGRQLKPGYKGYHLESNGHNVLDHFWMDDFSSFFAKHKKYLKDEGKDRYNLGERISLGGILYSTMAEFYRCYFRKKGYKDGFTGLFLSLFWAWYTTSANISLFKITLKANNNEG